MMKTESIQNELEFQDANKKRVIARFDDGTLTTDMGLRFLQKIERKLHVIERFSGCFSAFRKPMKIRYTVSQLVKQRAFAICQGYEDLNDHDALRHDPLFRHVCERTKPDKKTGEYISGKSTLNMWVG